SQAGDTSQRYFEIEGVRHCGVRYLNKNETYELEVYQPGEKPKTFQYDDIDEIAIEIFELIRY
ncbi:MAG: DUF1797 family protein, partial [Bacilli bacterium]